jgi:hypothetical protein|tara:strand:+ start:181 stop:912 length:732 start_codon:yes stop_codon:yes gene_type:complete
MNEQLHTRSWNGTLIPRRTTDGYVNATAMCRANEKRWANYFQTDRASEYLEALSAETGIPVSRLCLVKHGAETWVHSQVAVDLARWISAPFAVMMDGWLLEKTSPQQISPPILPDVLSTVEQSINLLERLGGVDDRAQMILRDVVINTAMKSAGGAVAELQPSGYLTLSEKLIDIKCPSHKATDIAKSIGKEVKAYYRECMGRDPKSQQQYVNGYRCNVALYEIDFLDSIEHNLNESIENALV